MLFLLLSSPTTSRGTFREHLCCSRRLLLLVLGLLELLLLLSLLPSLKRFALEDCQIALS